MQDPLQKKDSQESVHIEIPVVYDSSEVNPIPIPMGSVDSATNQESVDVQESVYSMDAVTVRSVREALAELVRSNTCWCKGAVNGMDISISNMWDCYYCTWEIFVEERISYPNVRTYTGGVIDNTEYGPVPELWEYPITPPPLFEDESHVLPVPHTEQKVTCPTCNGSGKITCPNCNGRGVVRHRSYDSKTHTYTTSTSTCSRCHGSGRITCPKCIGWGFLIKFQEIAVYFKSLQSYMVIDGDNIPDELLDEAESSVEEGIDIHPPSNIVDVRVQEACQILEMKADKKIADSSYKLLQERLIVKVIPIISAEGIWKDKTCKFWVYGNDLRAHAPHYRKAFYPGCSIM